MESMTDYTEDTPVRHRIRYNPTQRGGEEAYRTAQRHSRLVRTLRIVLPSVAVAGIVLFWASVHFIPSDLAGLVSKAGIDVKSNSVVMDAPHISGFEGTRRAYEVKAARAIQSLDDPKVLTFEKINARIGLDDAGIATVDAGTGIYNGNNNTLELKNGISIQTTTGYAATIQRGRRRPCQGQPSVRDAGRDSRQGGHPARQQHRCHGARQVRRLPWRCLGHLHAAGSLDDIPGG